MNSMMDKFQYFFKKLNRSVLIMALLLSSAAMSASAMENGNWIYPSGNEDFLANQTPVGWTVLNNTSYRHNTDLKDNSGDNIPIRYDVKSMASVFRIIYNSDKTLFGGYLGGYVVLPFVDLSIKLPMGDRDTSGLGDVTFGFSDAYVSKNRVLVFGADLITPTGSYDKNEIASIGSNHYTVEPYFIAHYLADNGFTIGGKLMYDYNFENHDTDYKSGQELHMDYIVGKKINNFRLGLGGYAYKQITDDKQNSSTIKDYKAQAVGVGPALMYDYKNLGFTVKYIKDYMVENKGAGDQLYLKINCAF